jgi:benzoate membrane transport protein
MVAWSTPGAAVLASAGLVGGFSMSDAVGAFMMSAALIVLVGATGWFERVMNRIPVALASALLAGVLARFGLAGFSAAQSALPLVVLMLLTYLLGKRFAPRYAVPATLLFAVLFVAAQNGFSRVDVPLGLTWPVFVAPVFSWSAFVSLALPLFIVTMASQNLPGVAAIRASGFGDERAKGGEAGIPVSKIITLTGVTTLLLAPLGAFSLNLSAITAAICMGPEAHPDRARRYTAAVSCGAIYIALGLFGATIMALLTAFPKELVAAIAGLALMGTIGSALAAALQKESDREAAMVTFLITLSGVVVGGVGSAFWGVVAGAMALAVQHYRPKQRSA